MFITAPNSEVKLPKEVAIAGHNYWRLVDSVSRVNYVAMVTFREDPPDSRRTIMFCWDSDLVHFIESPRMGIQIHSLQCIASDVEGSRLRVREVEEIWRGVDDESGGGEVIIFRTAQEQEYCGQEFVPVPESVRRLFRIATVGDSACNQAN